MQMNVLEESKTSKKELRPLRETYSPQNSATIFISLLFTMASQMPSETVSVTVHPTTPITTTVTTVPLPSSLAPNEVLIKVHAAASNPKDWIHPFATGASINSGDDLAGLVVAVGSAVSRFSAGDKVAAFHPMGRPYGAYAEYAVAPEHTTFHVPENVSFEEASTIPLVSATAALTLFRRQGYTPPWEPRAMVENKARGPLLIYAATTSLGTYATKLAKAAGIGPIIAIGGGNSTYLKTLLDSERGDVFLDYRSGMENVKDRVKQLVQERAWTLKNGLDAFSAGETWVHVSQMLHAGGTLSVFSGVNRYDEPTIPSDVTVVYTFVGTAHDGRYRPSMPRQPNAEGVKGDVEFTGRFFGWVEEMLKEGTFEGHPFELVPGGLEGVEDGIERLRNGSAGGKKLVYQVAL